MGEDGSLISGDATGVQPYNAGVYDVEFSVDVSDCAATATDRGGDSGGPKDFTTQPGYGQDGLEEDTVRVVAYNNTTLGGVYFSDFSLIVVCPSS